MSLSSDYPPSYYPNSYYQTGSDLGIAPMHPPKAQNSEEKKDNKDRGGEERNFQETSKSGTKFFICFIFFYFSIFLFP